MPEYFNEKINVALLLAPPASMYYSASRSDIILSMPWIMDTITWAAEALFVLDIVPYTRALSEVVVGFCRLSDGSICT